MARYDGLYLAHAKGFKLTFQIEDEQIWTIKKMQKFQSNAKTSINKNNKTMLFKELFILYKSHHFTLFLNLQISRHRINQSSTIGYIEF